MIEATSPDEQPRRNFSFVDGLWRNRDVVYVPDNMRTEALTTTHSSNFGGHPGVAKTLQMIQARYWWPSWRKDTKDFITKCHQCQVTKSDRKRGTPIQLLPVPLRPWESVAIDLLTGLPKVKEGKDTYEAITTVICRLTGFTLLIPCSTSISGQDLANLVFNRSFGLLGCPSSIFSDRDPRINSSFWQQFWRRMGTENHQGTGYHHNTGSSAERSHRSILQILRAAIQGNKQSWYKVLPAVEFAFNSWPGISGYTPHELMLTYPARSPIDAFRP